MIERSIVLTDGFDLGFPRLFVDLQQMLHIGFGDAETAEVDVGGGDFRTHDGAEELVYPSDGRSVNKKFANFGSGNEASSWSKPLSSRCGGVVDNEIPHTFISS